MPPPQDKRELGRLAEDDALAYLLLQGLKLVERNRTLSEILTSTTLAKA